MYSSFAGTKRCLTEFRKCMKENATELLILFWRYNRNRERERDQTVWQLNRLGQYHVTSKAFRTLSKQ